MFDKLPDPRRANAHHKRIDILTIALIGVTCGAGGWEGNVAYGKGKYARLKTFLELP